MTAVAELEPMPKKSPEPDDAPKTLFAVKGRETWYEWLRGYAEFAGLNMMTVIDVALREQAKRDGYGKPMPKRMGK